MRATLQVKNDMYYCVISYKDKKNNKWKLKWKTTKIPAKAGNKKKARAVIESIVQNFEKELTEKEELKTKEMNSYVQRIEEYKNTDFLQFIDDTIEEAKNRIQYTTYKHWKNLLNARIINYFGVFSQLDRIMNKEIQRPRKYASQTRLVDITQFDIEDFYKWLFDCGLKGSTVVKYHVLFNIVFKRAIRLKVFTLENNPMKDIQKPKVAPYTADYYKPNELMVLLDIMKNEKIYIPVVLSSFYGLRRSEALGLRWSAIDFENKLITIQHTVIAVEGVGNNAKIFTKEVTKNNDIRVLPLIPEVEEILLEHKRKIEENKKFYGNSYVTKTEEYVCVDEQGALIHPDYVTMSFAKILRENSDKIKRIKFHGLRHSVGSLLANNNVNQVQIQSYMGHKSIKSSAIYMHVNNAGLISSAKVIESQFKKAEEEYKEKSLNEKC